jgi:hypothetical protein
MNDNCVRARGWLAQWADGELAAAPSAWMESHWRECETCRGERDRFQALDRRLLALGEQIAAPAGDRAHFLAGIDETAKVRRKPLVFVPAAASVLAAAALLLMWLPQPIPRPAAATYNGFVAVPYFPPMASYERSSVVSMEIPVANLLAEGYTVAADPSSVVQADVLLGEDGSVHAVRLASNQMLKGTGE